MKKFVEKCANLNCQNKNGESALHQACQRRNVFAVQVLLENRALPNILNSVGETPLSFACKYDMPDVVEVLLKGGADPSTVPLDGLKESMWIIFSHNLIPYLCTALFVDILALLKRTSPPDQVEFHAVRLIPIRCTNILPPSKSKERAVSIEVQLGKETQRGDAEKVSSKNNSYKWVELNFDFVLNSSNRDSKIKIKLIDTKANEPLGIQNIFCTTN